MGYAPEVRMEVFLPPPASCFLLPASFLLPPPLPSLLPYSASCLLLSFDFFCFFWYAPVICATNPHMGQAAARPGQLGLVDSCHVCGAAKGSVPWRASLANPWYAPDGYAPGVVCASGYAPAGRMRHGYAPVGVCAGRYAPATRMPQTEVHRALCAGTGCPHGGAKGIPGMHPAVFGMCR